MKLKPTYEEQLAWLDLVGLMATSKDQEMIKAIKENVIAVRNYEKALDNELRPSFIRDRDQAFKDLLAYGDAVVRQPMSVEIQTFNESKELTDAIESINANYPESDRPFVFRADELNPREELAIDNRIKQLQGELAAQLSTKKQFRSQAVIDHCHKSINNLKKWKKNANQL